MSHTIFVLLVGCWIGGGAGALTMGLTTVSRSHTSDAAEFGSLDEVSPRVPANG